MINNSNWPRFLLFLCVSWYSSGSSLDSPAIEHQLRQDYQKLCRFSKQMKLFDVRASDFGAFFQKGIEASLTFYQGSCSPRSMNHIQTFENNIRHDFPLGHPLKKQGIPKEIQNPFQVLDRFSGEWFGKWKTMEVSHLWLPLRKSSLTLARGYELIGYQSCFTGDGFGWNFILRRDTNVLVLGYVYHFNRNGQLAYGNPHYGFVNGAGGLTWISNDHLYYEFLCQKPACNLGKHYVITAVPYASIQKPLFKNLTQAVYTSKNPKSDSNRLRKGN